MAKEITFSVDMAELKKRVGFVKNGLGRSQSDLAVMLFRFEIIAPTKASIFAANAETFNRTVMNIIGSDEQVGGAFAVMGEKIEKLISSVECEQVHFKVDGENLEVQAGFATIAFELYDGSAVKTVEQAVKDHLELEGLAVNRPALEEALICAKSCSSVNSVRPDVNHVEMREGRVLSSDGRKIMMYLNDSFPKEVGLKVPATALNDVIGSVKNIGTDTVQILEGKSYYYLKAGLNEFTMGIRKVERSFPQMESAIMAVQNPTDEISLDKNVFTAILTNVSLGLPTDEIKVTVDISGAKGNDGILEVSSLNSNGKRSYERTSCTRKHSDQSLVFPVSFKHVLDTLSVFKGDSVVDMAIVQKMNLMVIQDKTETRKVITAIPFRTDKAVQEERAEKEKAKEGKSCAKNGKKDEAAKPADNKSAIDPATVAMATTADVDL